MLYNTERLCYRNSIEKLLRNVMTLCKVQKVEMPLHLFIRAYRLKVYSNTVCMCFFLICICKILKHFFDNYLRVLRICAFGQDLRWRKEMNLSTKLYLLYTVVKDNK